MVAERVYVAFDVFSVNLTIAAGSARTRRAFLPRLQTSSSMAGLLWECPSNDSTVSTVEEFGLLPQASWTANGLRGVTTVLSPL